MATRRRLIKTGILAGCALLICAGGMPETEQDSEAAFSGRKVIKELTLRSEARKRRAQIMGPQPVPSGEPEARASMRSEHPDSIERGAATQAESVVGSGRRSGTQEVQAKTRKGVGAGLAHQLKLHGYDAQRGSDYVKLVVRTDDFIDYETDELTKTGESELDEISEILRDFFVERISVEGHTDSWGDIETNVLASSRRADLLAYALSVRGVPRDVIESTGRGEAFPLASNNTLEGRSRNRRIEILIW